MRAVDLAGYQELWHPSFIGWPIISPQPVRYDKRIADWIAENIAQELRLESYSIKPAANQAAENVMVVH